MMTPTSLISSLKSFAAVYRPHMASHYHMPRTMPVQPKIFPLRIFVLSGQRRAQFQPLPFGMMANHDLASSGRTSSQ